MRDEFAARLVDLCLKSGLTGLPRRSRDRHILLKSVVLTLKTGEEYSESDIDDRLAFWLVDVGRSIDVDRVSLRRSLVDEGYLKREKDGSRYMASSEGKSTGSLFEPEVDGVDVYEAIGIGMKQIQEKKRQHLGQRAASNDASGHAT